MRTRNPASRPLAVLMAFATLLLMALPALAGGRPLSTQLSPENEIPPADSDASGTADLTLNQGQGEVCFEIRASGFTSDVIMAHIHDGSADVNGPVVVTLLDPGDPGNDGATLPADIGLFADCVDGVAKSLIKDIRQNPDEFYVNVHTVDNPGGEIRGQLSK